MGKSSRKKKRSDASPLAPRKKKSKSKKVVRVKSEKLRRRRHDSDSDSYSSDYDSPGSSSYLSSEDDYKRRRRSRSLTRDKARGSKKRSRRRSYSSESSEDSRPARKRRRSKRKDGTGVRKKSSKKKKHKRRASVSSTSSGSLSCSTCDVGSERSGESEFESRRGRSRRRGKNKRDAGKGKVADERSGHRRRSSFFSECSMSSRDQDEEKIISATSSSMRLKSVIVIASEAEERKWDGDEHKEEILYDNDDYPSSHSNDSNNGGSNRELAHHSYVDSKMKGPSKEFAEAAAPNTGSALVVEKSGSIPDGALDEESKLRQMALERFKRFRGLTKHTAVSDQRGNNDDVKQTPAVSTKTNQNMVPQEVSAKSANTTQDEGNRARAEGRTSISTNPVDGRIYDQEHEAARPSSGGSIQVSGGGFPGRSPNRGSSSAANKPRVTAFTWRRDPGKTDAAAKASPRLLKGPSPQAKLLETEVAANKDAANLAKTGTSGNKSGGGSEVNKEGDSAVHEPSSSSRSESASGAAESDDKVKGEGKDAPQYEQKTMTVTRGGESIQVRYQVYIPKRAPALARRQLNR